MEKIKMYNIGRICVKLAGRDAGQKCVVVEQLEGKYVLVDGMTRRRKCNTLHLEPLNQTIEIKKGASHNDIVAAFKDLGLEVKTTKSKSKTEKQKHMHKAKETPAEEKPKKEKKPTAKTEVKPAPAKKKE